jgi:hypothetical protein
MDQAGIANTLTHPTTTTMDVRTPSVAPVRPLAVAPGSAGTPSSPQPGFMARNARNFQTAAGVISSIATLVGAIRQGEDMKARASQEEDLARERAEVRGRELRKARAGNRASAAGAGIAFEGSPAAIDSDSVAEFEDESRADQRFTRTTTQRLRRSSRSAMAAGIINAGGGIFQTYVNRKEIGRV